MSALNAALCKCGIILWLAVLLASRSTHSAPVYDQDTTQIAEYDGAVAGCYFNFQRYQEGDRIITSEPCLNCTCHNRMLMCYLKVCPFTKAIGQDCTIEKRPDQCCPVITCPEVPVQLLTSTTSAPDSTEIGFHDNYGCNLDNKFYADGVQLPTDHQNPCELCYCIRNRTTCVMQECTLQVAGCKPIYQPGVCCPIKYNCEYDEELGTTVAPTTGLIMTTTLPPGVLPECYHEGKVYEDGELINSSQPCQHCYCFRGEIACAVQNCGTPMQAHGKNCTALPPPEGECCPTTYECEEDEQSGVVTSPQGEEQVPHDFQTTESPALIDEKVQVTDHPKEETFPGADNAIPHEEDGIQETEQHITSTEKSEEKFVTLSEETETVSPQEHLTEAPVSETIPEEPITAKLPSEAEVESTEVPTTVEKTEELDKEISTVALPESSSVSKEVQPQDEIITTMLMPEEHVSTEENIIDTEPEEEQPGQTSSSYGTQTESSTKQEQDITSPHKELAAQIPEQVAEIEKATEEIQISMTETPKASTESIEKITSPESVTELTKEDVVQIYSTETTETESPMKQATLISNEVSSTEQIVTEKEEIHPTTETSSTNILLEEEQLPTIVEGEKEQESKIPLFEHTTIAEKDDAKEEDTNLTESPTLSEDFVTADEEHIEKETPEISTEKSTSIPERIPAQKADDENIYHMTEDITSPKIISPDNLVTEIPQKQPTAYPPADHETTFAPAKQTMKPIPEEIMEENLATQKESSITESITTHEEITSSPDIAYSSSEPTITTITYDKNILEEVSKQTKKPTASEEMTTVQSTEEDLINRLEVQDSAEVNGEEKIHPKKEQSTQPSIVIKPEATSEIPASIPIEISTELPDLEKEHAGDEKITTEISMIEVSTHVPQTEEKETEIIPLEEEKLLTSKKPELVTEESIIPTISDTEQGLQSGLQTTETIKETEEKLTTQISVIEEGKTEMSEQPSTEQVTEIHDLQKTEIPITEKAIETITEKESPVEKEVTQVIGIEQTELPVIAESSTEKIKEEDKEKMSTEAKLETTEISTVQKETEEKQTESTIIEEHVSSQPPFTDLMENQDQEPSKKEQESGTQTSKDEELQKQTILPEKEATTPFLEGAVTQSTILEEKLSEGTTELEVATKPATEEQSEIASTQPSGQEKEGHDIEKPDIQIRKETEIPSPNIYEEPHATSASTEKPIKTEESFTKPILISEMSTELPGLVEEHTKYEDEISVEKEIVTESLPSEEDTKTPILEEKPSQEEAGEEKPGEVSTEEIVISETPKVPIEERKPEIEISKETTTKILIYEQEDYSTLGLEEATKTKIPTEASFKETSQYSTEYPSSSITEEIPVEEEIMPVILPRPVGIPGEGNCLIEGQSYSNNSAVPPSNACQTTCRCISSIIQCELVQCPSPPAHLSNCFPIHTSGDLCCPMYACDTTPTELESGNHMIESHTPKMGEEEEGQKTSVLPVEISTAEPISEVTEATKDSSTLADEMSTSKFGPTETIISSVSESEEVTTTPKSIEPDHEQSTEKISEEHTISSEPSTLSQEEDIKHTEPQNIPEETTEGKIGEGDSTSTEQVSEESSTQAAVDQKPHDAKEESTIPPEAEPAVPTITKEEESSISTEKADEITTIVSTQEEELIPSKEEKKPIEEQPIEETEKEPPKEETTISSEKPVTNIIEEQEIPTKVEEPSMVTEAETEKPQISEEQETTEPTKFEEKEIVTEIGQTAQTEEAEIDTKLPVVYPSESETQKPIESSTLIHDHTPAAEVPLEEYTTLEFVETSTEEGKIETEAKISTEAPIIEEEHANIPTSSIKTETSSDSITEQDVDKVGEEIIKPTEAFIPEILHREVTEGTTGIESTEHSGEQTEISVTEHTERPSVMKLPEEIPYEPISPEVSTEQPVITVEEEGPKEEPQKPIESNITQEPGSTIEEHPEIIPEIESHTAVPSVEEHTIFEKIQPTSTSIQEETSEQPATSIIKDISKPSESKTEQPPISEAETQTPTIKEEFVTTSLEEQTPKSEEQPDQQTISSLIPIESVTSQEQLTEKAIEGTKLATELPELIDKQTIIPEIQTEEMQIPEADVTEQPAKEEEITIKEEITKEKAEADAALTDKTTSTEEHTEKPEIISSTEPTIKAETPIKLETTTILIKEPEQEIEITSEISLLEHPVNEEVTIAASMVPEKYPATPAEIEEKESTPAPEYSTTIFALEKEVSKLTTEGEKVPLEEESVILQDKTTPITPIIDERLPEEVDTEKESTVAPPSVEEEIHSTTPTEITSPHEEQPSIIELQPGGFTPSEEETLAPEEIQPDQPVVDEETHTSGSEESQPTEHAPEISATIETEEQTSTEAALPEQPIKISGVLPEEKVTIKSVLPEEIIPEGTIKPEEVSQSTETSVEQATKISAELPITSTTEKISEENEEAVQQHIDHFPKPTTKPEPDYSIEGGLTLGSDEEHLRPVNHTMEAVDQPLQPDSYELPITTLAPHITDYPDQSVPGEDNPHFPDEDYDEDDQAIYGPGTCRYGGKVFVSAQQIPRDDPCDFCFCFRSDIICLQQSCPPPIPGCHEEPISGFCCPRYECPVSMATAVNLTTTTTTTTTTLPPHFHANVYKGAARRSGCQIRGQAYRVGEVIKSASGPCLHCTCGGDGNMKCDPRVCTPEPMLRQMIAVATAKRRR